MTFIQLLAPDAPLSPVLSLSCFSNLLRLSLHTHGVRWLHVCQRSLSQFHVEPSHHLTQQKNLPLMISETQLLQEGLELSKSLCSCAKISTEALLLIFPIGEATPKLPVLDLWCWLVSSPLCGLSWGSQGAVGAALMALLGHNSCFLLSDFVPGFSLSLFSHVQAVTQSSSWVVWLLLRKLFQFHCSL